MQIYTNDIIFYATNEYLCEEFSMFMQKEFDMSIMRELKFFLRFQIKQLKNKIFIHQAKNDKEHLKHFGIEYSKPMKTPIVQGARAVSLTKMKMVNLLIKNYIEVWLVIYFILLLTDPILCMSYVYVHSSNLVLKSLI